MLALHTQPRDYLAGMCSDEKMVYLARTSYRDYLTQKVGLSLKATQYFGGRTLNFFAGRIEHVAAGSLRLEGNSTESTIRGSLNVLWEAQYRAMFTREVVRFTREVVRDGLGRRRRQLA